MSTKLFYILSTLALATFVVGASYAHDYLMVREIYDCYTQTKNGDQCGIN